MHFEPASPLSLSFTADPALQGWKPSSALLLALLGSRVKLGVLENLSWEAV